MICNKRLVFSFRAIAGAMLFLMVVEPAMAELEDMVVTVRRIEESAQEVPVSVSSFSAQTIEQARIRNVDDLANFTPNMTFESGEAGRRATPVIRGITTIDTRAFDNAVGIFIDGIFVSGRAVQNVNLLDVERVEVVRGPQSALFGRNTFSGAINYVTKKPTDDLDGKLEATAAEDGLYQLMGSVSGPLIADKLLGRIAAQYDEDDGMWENAGPLGAGDGIGGHEYKSISGSLTFLPTDSSSITLSGYYADDFLDSRPLNVAPNNCGELDPAQFGTLGSYDVGVPSYYCGDVPPLETDTYPLSPEAFASDSETTRLALDITVDFSAFRFVSLTGFTESESVSQQDLDRTQVGEPHYGWLPAGDFGAWAAQGFPPIGAPVLLSYLPPFLGQPAFAGEQNLNTYIGSQGLDNEYWSQEFRFESTTEGPLRWLGGLYFFNSENVDTTHFGIDASAAVAQTGLPTSAIQFLLTDSLGPTSPPPAGPAPPGSTLGVPTPILPNIAFLDGVGVVSLTEGTDEVTQYAAFGSLDYDFTERLTGTAELRFTYEEREITNITDDFFNTLPTGPTTFKDDWQFWDPRFILRYMATDDVMVYGSAAHGTRSGGLNVLSSDPASVPYDEETNWTYEAGMKSTWLDNRLQFNLAAFYIDWEDVQIRQLVSSSVGGLLTATTNGTGVTSYGVELELVAAPIDGLMLSFGYGYSNPEFDGGTIASGETYFCNQLPADQSAFPVIPVTCVDIDPNGDGVVDDQAPDIGGAQLRRSSKHTAVFTADLVKPFFVNNFEWMARLDVSYRSEQPTDLPATQWAPERTLANFKLGLSYDERFDIMLWVENMFGEDSIETTQTFTSNFNSRRQVTSAVNINDTRFGVTGRFRFGSAR